MSYNSRMQWNVDFHPSFEKEVYEFSAEIQDRIAKGVRYLVDFGPNLGRPHADTLGQSRFTNMKELRFKADNGVWRIAYAFDPERNAILLIAGNKSGVSQSMFYKQLIQKADERFEQHLAGLAKEV